MMREGTYDSESEVHGIWILVYPGDMRFLTWHGWDARCKEDVDRVEGY